MMIQTFLVCALIIGVKGQLNPLGRFGKCVDVSTVAGCETEGTWYLQYRPDNPDHYVHTCQAQYEKKVANYLTSLLYFYNKGKMVNNPQKIQYKPIKEGKYLRKITVDEDAVNIYMNVLYYDPEKKYRVLYLCTDYEKANPCIFNVEIATVEQCPANLAEVLSEGKAKLKAACDKFDVSLMKVEQSLDKCEPLDVSKECATDTTTTTPSCDTTTTTPSCDSTTTKSNPKSTCDARF